VAETKTYPIQYGKYELLERIGEGGMAEVFRARLPGAAGFEKILVVKRILPHLAKKPDFVRMFVDEAKLAAKVQHQNVVQVFELGETDGGELFMAMEYVSGVDLRRLLVNARDRKLRIPVWFVLHTISEVLSGLAYAHELCDSDGKPLSVVHRDVTPGNIFISYQGEVKLADFGIAKAAGRVSETEAGQVKGNAPFMSPEAIYGRTLDARADVFSAGVVLWASLALKLPFEGSSNYETAKQVCEAKRVAPSLFNNNITADLDQLALHVLEIDRSKRISSAREFQARVLEILARIRPRRLPQDVRSVVDVLLGRKAPDADFRDAPKQSPEVLRSLSSDLELGEGLILARPPVAEPRVVVVAKQAPAPIHVEEEIGTLEFEDTPLHDLPDEPLEYLAPLTPSRSVPVAPLYARPGTLTAPPIPGRPVEEDEMILADVPLVSMSAFMGSGSTPDMPLVTESRNIDRFFHDANPFFVRFHDGNVLAAKGVDELLAFCDPHGQKAIAVSVDQMSWIDIPTFARLCGFDYLAPDRTPPTNVKLVGQLEERGLVHIFAQLSRQRATGRLVIMDKGVSRVARREIDIVGGAPVYVYADTPQLQFPHLYVQHRLMKRELMPDLVVAAVRQQKPLEDLAKQFAFIDLNPYRPACMRDRLGDIFTWRFGRFAFDAGRRARGAQPFTASLLRALPDAVSKGYSAEELHRALEPHMSAKMRRAENFEIVLADLAPKDKQAAAARRLGQRQTLLQTLKKYPADTHATLVMAMILTDLEVLTAA
jgi:serine/threonine protein kinase